MKTIFKIITISLFISFILSVEFLDTQPKLEFEYTIYCGNSYFMQRGAANDIIKQLKERGYDIEHTTVTHKKDEENNDNNFNIYLIKEGEKTIIATSNPDSDKYEKILANYPGKFINDLQPEKQADPELITQRENLIERILYELRAN